MKKINKLFLIIIILLTIIPKIVFAYSNKIILGGENIGIKVNSKYVMIVGFYKVNNQNIGEEAGLKVGDYITKINEKEVHTIDEMISILNNQTNLNDINITYIHDNNIKTTKLKLVLDDNSVYKTGLYVKDQVTGIGTLTYIDPLTNIFGALGHEISNKNTYKKLEINNGNIFKSEVTGIKPSKNNEPGSKEAKLYIEKQIGTINKNLETGIYGKVTNRSNSENVIEVASSNEIELGNAKLRTVIDGFNIKEYDINIIDIDFNNDTKNLLFEITDDELIKKTGGVVAGMSGSPIIQNNKIIGAVTHVVVTEPLKGYGIFITTMLENGELDNN